MTLDASSFAGGAGLPSFTTTRWTVVRLAAHEHVSAPDHQHAWEHLCRSYWLPLYVFARRRGLEDGQSEDVVQDFFLHLLEDRVVDQANHQRGRFRTFLLGCFSNFLANRKKAAAAVKRGGRVSFVSLEELDPTELDRQATAQDWSPECAYDIGWAHTLVERVVGRLRREAEARGKGRWFDELRVFLPQHHASLPEHGNDADLYQNAAARLGLTVETLRTAVHRLRARFRDFLREEVIQTVETPDEVDAELRHLRSTLSLVARWGK